MDPCDRAHLAEERHRSQALAAAHRGRPAVNADGLCSDCGFAVEPARLAVDPTAERCIECQQEHEYLEAARVRNGGRL